MKSFFDFERMANAKYSYKNVKYNLFLNLSKVSDVKMVERFSLAKALFPHT